MSIEELRSFVKVVELGKVNRAAEVLHMVPPGVSRHLRQLEADLGRPLFRRTHKKLEMTSFGRAVYEIAAQIVGLAERLGTLTAAFERKLMVGASVTAAPSFIPHVVRRFREQFAEIEVRVQVGFNEDILAWLRAGKIDVGVVSFPVHHEDICTWELFFDPLLVICSQQHPFAACDAIDITKLADSSLIGFPAGRPFRRNVEELFETVNVVPEFSMEIDSFEIIKRMVEADLGVAILPRSVCLQELRAGSLHGARLFRMTAQGPELLVGNRRFAVITQFGLTKDAARWWTAVCQDVAEEYGDVESIKVNAAFDPVARGS